MSDLINGFAFLRDTNSDELPKGMKRIIVCGVAIVPKDILSDDNTYEVKFIPSYFEGEPLSIQLDNPKRVLDPKNGYRIDQILTSPSLYIPGYAEANDREEE